MVNPTMYENCDGYCRFPITAYTIFVTSITLADQYQPPLRFAQTNLRRLPEELRSGIYDMVLAKSLAN